MDLSKAYEEREHIEDWLGRARKTLKKCKKRTEKAERREREALQVVETLQEVLASVDSIVADLENQ